MTLNMDLAKAQDLAHTAALGKATAMAMDLDPAMATNTGTGTDTATAMDFELALAPSDSNTASDTASDMATVQPLGSAMAMATTTVTAMDSEEGADTVLTSDMDLAKALDLADARASSAALASQSVDMVLNPSQALASQSDDDGSRGSRFSLVKQDVSSEESELTGDDDVTKEEKKRKLELDSLSWKKLPSRNKTRQIREKSDPQLLYHCRFTMLMRHTNSNLRPNPVRSIEEILSNRRMRNVPTNARINVMVESWSLSTRTKSYTMSTVNLDGIVGEDDLSCQSIYEDGMKEIQPQYEGLFGTEKVIQDGQLLRIYTKLLEALNEIRLQVALMTNLQ